MNLKQTIKVLEEHNRWRRDNNVPAKTKMAEPEVLGMALDRAIGELKKLLISNVSHWVAYDWNDISSRPPKYGKYFVYRKDGKVHWETWNGIGWAYNEKVITHWQEVKPPCC